MSGDRGPSGDDSPPSADAGRFAELLRAVAAAPSAPLPLEFAGTERFEPVRRLGDGGFGVVFECVDRLRGDRVALKVLREGHGTALYRFKHEFRVLADLAHENLVRLHELDHDGRAWFFTMELVEGVPWTEHASRSTAHLRGALAQLERGLSALHRAGTLHRDLKPANVLVTHEGRVVLLDFGLAADVTTHSTEVAGTPRYMAPEQAGGGAVTEACDWYAVGVMLFEALTGRAPFEGSAWEVLEAKRSRPAPSPLELAPDAPAELAALCSALLARDPAARATGEHIAAAVGEARPAAPSTPVETFVGRDAELAALLAAFDATAPGAPRAVVVRGASGVGKSALLRRFAARVVQRRPDALVLAGRCYERETVPYKALDAVVDELVRWLARRSDAEIASVLPRDVDALARLFPVVRRIAAAQPHPSRRARAPGARSPSAAGEEAEARRRGVAALRELLARLGDRRPVVVCVDDLQWGDADSGALLAELTCPPDAPGLLFVGSHRDDSSSARPASPFFAALAALTVGSGLERVDVALEPLAADEAQRLASRLLDEAGADPALAPAIASESLGSPFFVHELVRHGATGAPAPRLDEAVARRVGELDEAARAIVEALSVADAPLPVDVLAHAAGLGPAPVMDALAGLRAARVVRTIGDASDAAVETYHDRIASAVRAGLPAADRRAWHARLAGALERSASADPERVARHLVDAGEVARAAVLARRAAERAIEALAFDRAASLFRLTLDLRARAGLPGGERELWQGAGDALSGAGRCADAADAYLRAADGLTGLERVELLRLAAERLLVGGHVDRGKAVLASVFRDLGMRMPSTSVGALALALPRRAWLSLRRLELTERPASAVAPSELVRIDVLWTASVGLALLDPFVSVALSTEHTLRALRAGEVRRAFQAMCSEATGSAYSRGLGAAGRTADALARARALAPRAGLAHGELVLASTEGIVALLEGRFADALQRNSDAIRLAREHRIGSSLELPRAECLRQNVFFWQGRCGDARRELPSLVQRMHERGNRLGWSWLMLYVSWARVARGEIAAARDDVEAALARWSSDGFQLQHWWKVFAGTHIDLYEGSAARAWGSLEAIRPALRRSLVIQGQLHRIEARWLRARVAVALAAGGRPGDRALLAGAEADVDRIERERTAWGDAHAALTRAGIASVRGDRRAAAQLLERAETALVARALPGSAMAARHARGRLLAGDEGQSLVASAQAWMTEQGVVDASRWSDVTAPGRWTP